MLGNNNNLKKLFLESGGCNPLTMMMILCRIVMKMEMLDIFRFFCLGTELSAGSGCLRNESSNIEHDLVG